MSDDGQWSIVVIALLGNPFSPRYASARAEHGEARALDYCALNVSVQGPSGNAWALRERRISESDREPRSLSIGRSSMRWDGDALVVDIDEVTSPFARPLRGTVRFYPAEPSRTTVPLDGEGRHTWWPIAPTGRIEVVLDEPSVRFRGHGYHDANAGDVALERSFARWTWCRAPIDDHRTWITYDVTDRDGRKRCVALDLDARRGDVRAIPPLRVDPLPTTRWRISREARTEGMIAPRVVRELEDTPFYARTLVETRLGGRRVTAMHETLSLERFDRPWVRFLLGFRMGRA